MLKAYIKRHKKIYKALYNIYWGFKWIVEVYIRMFVFYIGAFGRKIHFPGYYNKYKKIKDLKGKYEGKRVFIVATGPSLTLEDVEKLDGEITFAVNSVFKLFDRTKWRPTHYVIGDIYLYKEYCKHGQRVEFDDFCIEESFVSHPFWKVVKGNQKAKRTVVIPFLYYDHWLNDNSKQYHYSDDLMFGIKDLYMVTVAIINIAQYMGVKEIYLIGTDCNYSGSSKHFGDTDKNIDTINPDAISQEKKQKRTWKFIHEEMEKRGVKIYNATRGGKLEEFERVDLDKIIK